MPLSASIPVAPRRRLVPRQYRRSTPSQLALFPRPSTGYRRFVRDIPTTWAAYIEWAASRVAPPGRRGGIAQLARLTGLSKDTLFVWKSGRHADTPTVRHIRLVAEAVGDDVRNAMRAAGRLTGSDAAAEPHRQSGPTLADQLRTIRESGLPVDQQIQAAAELVALYRRPGPAEVEDGDADPEVGRRASA